MSPLVRTRPAAQHDLLEHFVALGERAGEATARRFLQAAALEAFLYQWLP